MPGLADLQARLIDYLSGRGEQIARAVADQGNIDAPTRLNIYRNAYHIRLRQALETDHEMLGRYLGDELFETMASGYIAAHPSHFTSLRHFGHRLPDYLARTAPFSEHPVISELARFERRLLDVFDAADAARVPLSALSEISPDQWPGMTLHFHFGTQLFEARWNSIECWKALKAGLAPPEPVREGHARWLLWRGADLLSEFRPLDEDEYRLLVLAREGHSFATLCESLVSRHDEERLGAICLGYLSRWFEQGIISEVVAG